MSENMEEACENKPPVMPEQRVSSPLRTSSGADGASGSYRLLPPIMAHRKNQGFVVKTEESKQELSQDEVIEEL